MSTQPCHCHVVDVGHLFVSYLPACAILIVIVWAVVMTLGKLSEQPGKRRAAAEQQTRRAAADRAEDDLTAFVQAKVQAEDAARRARRTAEPAPVIDGFPVDPNWMHDDDVSPDQPTGPVPYVPPRKVTRA